MSAPRRQWGRVTRSDRRVLMALLTCSLTGVHPTAEGLARVARIRSARAYDTLAKVEALNWADSVWEARDDGMPRRRFYFLTPDGGARVAELLGLYRAGSPREVTTA